MRRDVTPTAADFVNAKTARFAWIVTPTGTYTKSLPAHPEAQWVAYATNRPGVSALYAIPFQVDQMGVVSSATLDLNFAADNALNGVFINGSRISGESYVPGYQVPLRLFRNDIAPLLRPGETNWLYLNVSDYGLASALIFGAKITVNGGASTESVVPERGDNTGATSVRIYGKNFPDLVVEARLTAPGRPDIVGAFSRVVGDSLVRSTFDLRGAEPGVRNVALRFKDGRDPLVLPAAFTVEAGGGDGPQLCFDLIVRENFRPDRPVNFTVVVTNCGGEDAYGILVWVGFPPGSSVTVNTPIAPPPGASGAEAMPPVVDTSGGPVLPVVIPALPSGETETVDGTMRLPDDRVEITLREPKPLLQLPPLDPSNPPSNPPTLFGLRFNPADAKCLGTIISNTIPSDEAQCILGLVNDYIVATAMDHLSGKNQSGQFGDNDNGRPLSWSQMMYGAALDCGIEDLSPDKVFQRVFKILDVMNTAREVYEDCVEGIFGKGWIRRLPYPVSSFDPNEKLAPVGAGEARYVSGNGPLAYTILFENKSTATAPAQEVVITDSLDPEVFDLNTFSLGSVKFGADRVLTAPRRSRSWETVVDLRPQRNLLVRLDAQLDVKTGVVTWLFQSLDPTTKQPPEDPLSGFLPPNITSPEGEGSVQFTVAPKKALPTGAVLNNVARIVFDTNEPIDTARVFNTLDKTAPASRVLPLPPVSPAPWFEVRWEGADAESGVGSYTIFVSHNSGPYTVWLHDVKTTSAIFNGEVNKTYAFYSVAQDATANREDVPTSADATTVTVSNISQFSNSTYSVGEGDGKAVITITRAGDASEGATVYYTTKLDAAVLRCDVINGQASERCDYTTSLGVLKFAPGQTTAAITIPIFDDVYAEGPEVLQIRLHSPAGGGLGGVSSATVTIQDNDAASSSANPVDNLSFFVRQQYLDFLSREPEQAGFDGWVAKLNQCPPSAHGDRNYAQDCTRIDVSASFFRSKEFGFKGFYVYKFYAVSFGRRALYAEFIPDMSRVSGATDEEFEANRAAFPSEWVARQAFKDKFDSLSNSLYVNTLLQTAGATVSNSDVLIGDLEGGRKTRAQVLKEIVESPAVDQKFYNEAFVAMQYFGYLRRDPDQGGFDGWLNHLNRTGNYREMVWGFLYSPEHKLRFGPVPGF